VTLGAFYKCPRRLGITAALLIASWLIALMVDATAALVLFGRDFGCFSI
jgi:hypothetical protein